MAANEVHYNDIGTRFTITIKDNGTVVDISGATTKQILFKPPNAATKTFAGTFTTDGTDGLMYYDSVDGDLDEVGTWQIQCNLVISAKTFRTDIAKFKVHRNI